MTMVVPTITLKNGLTIANFSSPHPFNFVTGETLEACSDERCKAGSLNTNEIESEGVKGTKDIRIEWEITDTVSGMIKELQDDKTIDIVLVPLPVLQAVKASESVSNDKLRVVRVADRINKTIYNDRFCV